MRNRQFIAIGVVSLGIVLSSGCATRKYVRMQTQALEPAIEEASNATKSNAERIDSVDRRAQQSLNAAEAADQKAIQAQQAAADARSAAQAAERRADGVNQAVQGVDNRINTLETRIAGIASMNDNYTVSETQTIMFAVNSSTLSEQARRALDSIASSVGGARTGYMLELQGFTDSTGSEQYNINLSKRRTESVERYLVGKNVPLFRISIVGLGEENPVADNKTREGRNQNRRVEVKVLTASGTQAN